jgi:hypothetical protein
MIPSGNYACSICGKGFEKREFLPLTSDKLQLLTEKFQEHRKSAISLTAAIPSPAVGQGRRLV